MNKKEIIETINMTIDYESLVVLVNNHSDEVKLSLNEANLLFLFYSNPNKIYTKDEIYLECWQDGAFSNSVVTQTISLLRKKFLKYNILGYFRSFYKKGVFLLLKYPSSNFK
ncbi:winged helix-turn-helix domain-containing protein [Aliivibrio sifiae]|uniref:OmpR/PhoB-type domain-containing protein n=1 Tax=Aliivibrio sifiae TaxID=566293 RepID=A0A2S7X462_9GAMM|nr:winged helix-turn-helix domain-containing protein [Aliivibrio sifiae]PQJ84818.1 hypothetical protein BTO22_15100 [Aliivibrio sifiae]